MATVTFKLEDTRSGRELEVRVEDLDDSDIFLLDSAMDECGPKYFDRAVEYMAEQLDITHVWED